MSEVKSERGLDHLDLPQSGLSNLAAVEATPTAPAVQLIFLHSSWRTSSTWFWSKFRPFSETACFFEPFSEELGTITSEKAAWAGFNVWDSRHPPIDPYYLEYLPIIQSTGGVALFDRPMSLDWFIPVGGLRGELREAEIQYLALLIEHAREQGKTPVFGATRSLGRLWAIKSSFGGFHVFLHRNLWRQWLSYLYHRRRSYHYIYETTALITARSADPFLADMADFYGKHALDFRLRRDGEENGPLSDDERVRLLRSLPENHAFAMFMALHIYLYLHAQLTADLTVDVTRLARDSGYRSRIESELARQTGLEISLSDVADEQRASGIAIGAAAIDWDEIREHTRAAVRTLSAFADPTELMESASAFIDSTIAEMHRSEAALAMRADAAEEIWYARLQEARCHWGLGDEDRFLRQALVLREERPSRAEPLFDLARFHRERGMYETAADFAEAGFGLERPSDDAKFVEDFVYQAGLYEELSIAAFHCCDPARQDRGFAACNWLALNRDVGEHTRNLARGNLRFYTAPASDLMPSFTAHPVGFSPPEGWHATNPSVTRRGDEIVMAQRVVNYVLPENGIIWTSDSAFKTRNFLLRLSPSFDTEFSIEILPPSDLPASAHEHVQGFEDLRPFVWCGALWCSAATRELDPDGWHQQVLARVDEGVDGQYRLAYWRILALEGPRRYEKNWMPFVEPAVADGGDERLRFIYLCDPTRVVDENARVIAETTPTIAAEQFRGGSQAIAFADGWLALIHEVIEGAALPDRVYHHRFVWFDKASALRGVSRPFFFQHHGIEFAAGLTWHPDGRRLIISYGVRDAETWIATVDANDICRVLDDSEHLPSGAPQTEASTLPLCAMTMFPKACSDREPIVQAGAAEGLHLLRKYDWVSHNDRRIVRLGLKRIDHTDGTSPSASVSEIGVSLEGAELVFGPARFDLSAQNAPFVWEKPEADGQVPGRVLILDEHGTVHTFSRFQPLLYFCVYGNDSYYECLQLSLASLAERGCFDGAIGVACDRPKSELMRYVPEAFHDRLVISGASKERGWFNQYYLEHGLYDAFQPILYCDVDVIFDANITDLLIDILLCDRICCATEQQSLPDMAENPPRFWDEFLGNYFGRSLYLADPDFRDTWVPLGNAGVVGFPNVSRIRAVNDLVRSVAARQTPGWLNLFSDQPILNYALYKTGLGDFEVLDRYCRLTRTIENVAPAGRRGIVHFHLASGEADASPKRSLMRSYLDTLAKLDESADAAFLAEKESGAAVALNRAIPGQMSEKELECLARLAREVPPNGCIVEVGALFGLSSWTLAKNAHPSVTVYSIDPWVREGWMSAVEEQGGQILSPEAFRHNVSDLTNIIPLRGYSPKDFEGWQRSIDMVFEDSVHTNPVLHENLSFWTPLVRPGGIICGHDYSNEFPDVKTEVDALAAKLSTTRQVVETLWSMRISRAHSELAAKGHHESELTTRREEPWTETHFAPFNDSISQHALRPARNLKSRLDVYPRVLIAILAKQKEKTLPLFLRCIEGLDYPKSSIVLYVRTNNNTDRSEEILREWIDRVRPFYAAVEFDATPVEEPVEAFGQHEWNPTRFRVLGNIRNVSLSKPAERACDFYFVCDVDNFILPSTLRELVALKLPIVAPLLRVTDPNGYYSNFFAEIDPNGFYSHCDQYQWILQRRVRGVFEVPVVHCTYLIRGDVIPRLGYLDGSDRYEFVVFSDSARKAGIQQYIDNRQVYGYITFDAESDAAKGIVGDRRHDQIATAARELERAAGCGPSLAGELATPGDMDGLASGETPQGPD